MRNIWKGWRFITETVEDTLSAIRGVAVVAGIIGGIFIVIGKWWTTANYVQKSGALAVIISAAVIGFTYFLAWKRVNDTNKIPELLLKLDQMTLDYIDNVAHSLETPEALVDDLAKLFGWDIAPLKSAAKFNDKQLAEAEFRKFAQRYETLLNRKKVTDSLANLRLMGALMDDYKVGLSRITTTKDYERLFQRVKTLQRRLSSVDTSKKVNEYFYVSEGLYSVLLSSQPFMNLGSLKTLIPTRLRAYRSIMRPLIEGHTATLISAVRESIEQHKTKRKESEV
jgi:hypothetical protein